MRVVKAPKPGADLLGQGAAALAAVSVVFKDRDAAYSDKLLEVARGLYNQVGRRKVGRWEFSFVCRTLKVGTRLCVV